MNVITQALLAVSLLLLASCGGDTPESLTADFRTEMTNWLEVAEPIDSKAKLDDAKADLEAIVKRIETIKLKAAKLPKEDQVAMSNPTGDDVDLTQRMASAMMRIMTIENGAQAGDMMGELLKTLDN